MLLLPFRVKNVSKKPQETSATLSGGSISYPEPRNIGAKLGRC